MNTPPARPRPRAAAGVLLVCLALLLTGCGLRLEGPPPQLPAPDAVEMTRQEAARTADDLARAAGRADGDEELGLAAVAEASAEHGEALGGVWEPWPDGAPDGAETPAAPAADVPADPVPADVLRMLTRSADAARQAALDTPDADLAALLTAVAAWRTWAAVDLAGRMEEEIDIDTGAPYAPAALAQAQVDSTTVEVLDSARYAYEVAAARTEDGAHERAAARTEYLRSLTDAAAQASATDTRRAAYGLGDDLDPARVASAAERRLLDQLVFRISVVPHAARADLVAAAVHTAGELRSWGGQVPALAGVQR